MTVSITVMALCMSSSGDVKGCDVWQILCGWKCRCPSQPVGCVRNALCADFYQTRVRSLISSQHERHYFVADASPGVVLFEKRPLVGANQFKRIGRLM